MLDKVMEMVMTLTHSMQNYPVFALDHLQANGQILLVPDGTTAPSKVMYEVGMALSATFFTLTES